MPASKSKIYDVFISYRREHGAEVARLVKAELRQRGIAAFLDVDDLLSGHFDSAAILTKLFCAEFKRPRISSLYCPRIVWRAVQKRKTGCENRFQTDALECRTRI